MSAPLWLARLIKKAFPYRKSVARWSKNPLMARLMEKTLFNGDDLIYLPKDRVVVQQAIPNPGSTVLPSRLVDHFIEQASHRFIMHACICREGDHCQDFPHDLGCIFLGEAVLSIHPGLGRLASVEETLAHAQRAREMGLVHLIGRDRIDNLWMGAKPFGKLLTICQCCPCCCLFRVIPDLDSSLRSKINRMDGVQVWVDTDACRGCGKCARGACFVEAITLRDGKAAISPECRGCGRCVEICPHGAIHLSVADTGYVEREIRRISALVDVNGAVK